jgi:hypothetical protein
LSIVFEVADERGVVVCLETAEGKGNGVKGVYERLGFEGKGG